MPPILDKKLITGRIVPNNPYEPSRLVYSNERLGKSFVYEERFVSDF